MIRELSILTALLVSQLTPVADADSSHDWVPVSPGSMNAIVTIDQSCPTFSWAGTHDDGPLVLEVVEIQPTESKQAGIPIETRRIIEARIPGGSRSWTVSGRQCLKTGASYAWSVRNESDTPAREDVVRYYFRVWDGPRDGRPSMAEVDWARDVLQRALATTGGRKTDAPMQAAAVSHPSAGTPAVPVGPPTQRGVTLPPALRVDGAVFTRELRGMAMPPTYQGDIRAAALIEAASGSMVSPRVTLSNSSRDFYTLRATAPGEVTVCDSGASCDTNATPTATGRVQVGRLRAGQVIVDPGDGRVRLSASNNEWEGNGGSGFFEVPSLTNVNVDNNYSACAGPTVAVGVQLWETDNNQIGIRIKCSR